MCPYGVYPEPRIEILRPGLKPDALVAFHNGFGRVLHLAKGLGELSMILVTGRGSPPVRATTMQTADRFPAQRREEAEATGNYLIWRRGTT